MKNDYIQILDNGEALYVDIKGILYNGGIGNTNDLTFTKHIGGENPRSVSFTVSFDTSIEHHSQHRQEQQEHMNSALNMREFMEKNNQ